MKVKVFDQKGKENGELTLSDDVFKATVNVDVLSQYVYGYLSNQRQANAHTKDRSEVAGSRKKPWRQKGTGRARVGTKQNPIWKGGGVAFGPTNERNWKKNMNKKFKQAAMKQSLSKSIAEKELMFVNEIKVDEKKPLTKQAIQVLKSFKNPKKMTIVTSEVKSPLVSAFGNIPKSQVIYVKDLNAYDILNAGQLLIEEKAAKILDEKLNNKKK